MLPGIIRRRRGRLGGWRAAVPVHESLASVEIDAPLEAPAELLCDTNRSRIVGTDKADDVSEPERCKPEAKRFGGGLRRVALTPVDFSSTAKRPYP